MPLPKILHLHSSFSAGGKELRSVQLINAFGRKVQHTIVSTDRENMQAAQSISRAIPVTYSEDFPSLKGAPMPGRLARIARAMQGFDLVLTYNWGAMDAVMARTLFSQAMELPPLIHHEDGFNEDEADRPKRSRSWYRRVALGRVAGLVVPSERLEEIALVDWQQPIGRVRRIANGIDTKAFAKRPKPDALRGVVKRPGERWVGTLAGLRPVKNLPRLVRAFQRMPAEWQLVIVGEGEDRDRIRAEADRLGISDRVHLPGHVSDPARYIGLFDIFALSSESEQFPISVVEAMAAGLPVVAPEVGDIAAMVSTPNVRAIVARGNEVALGQALADLAANPDMLAEMGKANREKARAQFDEAEMIARYRRLYASAMGRDSLP